MIYEKLICFFIVLENIERYFMIRNLFFYGNVNKVKIKMFVISLNKFVILYVLCCIVYRDCCVLSFVFIIKFYLYY